ncbi:membrane lipoprotein lipid attachment site-containing protein [Virgibacillus senegalensis]|uniref:membrane lipoprotein lipid attachment site-containing protein n=1 Tax=Virgibacillus senegalensis TaxID=1499679 RepID=UPI00069CD877|nr:membrane lipoprotein lipid attachment site-containing protein [Virgibacillus senegalensis]
MKKLVFILLILFYVTGCSANSMEVSEEKDVDTNEIDFDIYMSILKNEVKSDFELTNNMSLKGYSTFLYDELEYDEKSFNILFEDGEEGDVIPVAFIDGNKGILVRKKYYGDNQVYNINFNIKNDKWEIIDDEIVKSDLVITEDYLLALYEKDL